MNHRHGISILDHLVELVKVSPDIRDAKDTSGTAVDYGRHRGGSVIEISSFGGFGRHLCGLDLIVKGKEIRSYCSIG
jgi:hypothetical protein